MGKRHKTLQVKVGSMAKGHRGRGTASDRGKVSIDMYKRSIRTWTARRMRGDIVKVSFDTVERSRFERGGLVKAA